MNGVLVDSDVLIDVIQEDPQWVAWSTNAIEQCAAGSALIINPVIYAEIAAGYPTIEALDAALSPELLRREPLPWPAGFLAGRAFVSYRRNGGPRTSLLPDFLIGAHAAVAGYEILTRDVRRYRRHFPTVELIAPPEG